MCSVQARSLKRLSCRGARPTRLPVDNFLQLLGQARAFLRDCRRLSDGLLEELRGRVEQLADAQVDQDIPARDAVCDVIRDVAAGSVSEFIGRFQCILPEAAAFSAANGRSVLRIVTMRALASAEIPAAIHRASS